MKVSELISELKECNQNGEVLISCDVGDRIILYDLGFITVAHEGPTIINISQSLITYD